jgi:VWFA-related protein
MRLRAVASLLFFSFPLLSQEAAPPVSATVEVRLIEVDATVMDRDGNPVRGLTAEDFILLENGKPKTITNFSEYRETVSLPPAVLAPTPSAPPPIETTVEQPAPRKLVIFIDVLPSSKSCGR